MRTFLALALGAALLAPTAPAAAASTVALPPPTGVFPVGVETRHLVDQGRADPWVPSRRRELMISLWYPARHSGGSAAPYVTPAESALILQRVGATGVPPEVLSTVRTQVRKDVPRLPGRLPLVVLSPGFGLPRTSLTGLAEELASRGHLVAGIDHTYEAAAITFPDGRIEGCLLCDAPSRDGNAVAANRARDVSFVLDRLRGLYDERRVSMVGHSMGGASAAATMLTDRRVRLGVNLDGSFQPAVAPPGLRRPFVMLGAEKHGQPGADESWDKTWVNLHGPRQWLSVAGTKHFSFTDYAPLGDQVGLPQQTLDGARCLEITRGVVVAALAHRPAPKYLELVRHRP